MQSGLQTSLGASVLRTNQFLPGLKWRVNRDTSDNYLLQYSVNGGAWATMMIIDKFFGTSYLAGAIYPGLNSAPIIQSNTYLYYVSSLLIGVNGAFLAGTAVVVGDTNTGISRRVTKVVLISDWLQWAGQSRVATQFDVAASTTLANITGLTATVAAGRTYNFRAVLDCALDATGGGKWAIGGTATATAINYRVYHLAASSAVVVSARQTALASAVNSTATLTDDAVVVEGLITVNAAGTLTAQFSQSAASGTSSVLVGSTFTVFDVQ